VAKGKPLRRKTRLAFALVPALLVGVELLTGRRPAARRRDSGVRCQLRVAVALRERRRLGRARRARAERPAHEPRADRPRRAQLRERVRPVAQGPATGQAFSSLTELQAYLNDPARDGDFAGVHVDVGAPTLGQTGGNVYYVCPSTYGDYISTRAIAPGLITFLQNLSQGDAFNTATTGTSGFRETAIVFRSDVKFNTNPIHPDTPGHFTCGP
jgi:hypothetical protein